MRVSKPLENTLPVVAETTYLAQAPVPPTPIFENSTLPVNYGLMSDLALAECLWRSGFFTSITSQHQAIAKMQMGKELGIGPVTALRELYVIQGRLAMSATLMGAKIKSSGKYNYRITELTTQSCNIEFFELGELVGSSAFNMDDAVRAGIAGKDNWKKWPKDMLFARALSAGARRYCPDIFLGGAYVPEELGAEEYD